MDEKDFAMRLATLRTKKNVSAREMSLSIWLNQGYINHFESGQGTPSLSGVFYICEYLGITPSQFFDFDIKNPEKLNKINEYLKKLNDEQLDALEMFLKSMTSGE